jgi:hypothetical protein
MALPWISLLAIGLACAAALYGLHRTGRLAVPPGAEPLPATVWPTGPGTGHLTVSRPC